MYLSNTPLENALSVLKVWLEDRQSSPQAFIIMSDWTCGDNCGYANHHVSSVQDFIIEDITDWAVFDIAKMFTERNMPFIVDVEAPISDFSYTTDTIQLTLAHNTGRGWIKYKVAILHSSRIPIVKRA